VLIKGTRSDAYTSTALGRRNEIHLAKTGMINWVLMHELAHIAMFHIDRNRPSHGPDYAAVYRRLVGRFISDEYRRNLDLAFETNRVSAAATSPRVLKALAAATQTEV
jgi:predicted SprT family Zn-dependent metalloprotease